MNEQKKKLPTHCPSCESALKIGRLYCDKCETEVCGSFELPVILQLNAKEQEFLLDFVKSSGSLKDMAKGMGISYPTVRNLLDDLIEKINQLENRLDI